jgi:hypothetical protein
MQKRNGLCKVSVIAPLGSQDDRKRKCRAVICTDARAGMWPTRSAPVSARRHRYSAIKPASPARCSIASICTPRCRRCPTPPWKPGRLPKPQRPSGSASLQPVTRRVLDGEVTLPMSLEAVSHYYGTYLLPCPIWNVGRPYDTSKPCRDATRT